MAQRSVKYEYQYDDSGNRMRCWVITLKSATPAPPDSLQVTREDRDERDELAFQTSLLSPNLNATTDCFVGIFAQVEIRIFPNPTTENVTLEIVNMEKLQSGSFTLFSMNGQLLQEYPVHDATTIVSLAGQPAGTYLLKVNMNNRTENWKIMKQ
jgi:hypothetical protein